MTKTEDNPMHPKTREPSPLRQAPRCLAQTRRGTPCQNTDVRLESVGMQINTRENPRVAKNPLAHITEAPGDPKIPSGKTIAARRSMKRISGGCDFCTTSVFVHLSVFGL
jgi:hypothetical protein